MTLRPLVKKGGDGAWTFTLSGTTIGPFPSLAEAADVARALCGEPTG